MERLTINRAAEELCCLFKFAVNKISMYKILQHSPFRLHDSCYIPQLFTSAATEELPTSQIPLNAAGIYDVANFLVYEPQSIQRPTCIVYQRYECAKASGSAQQEQRHNIFE